MQAKKHASKPKNQKIVLKQAPLSIDDLIIYQKFLLMTTQRTTQETKLYAAFMQKQQLQLEEELKLFKESSADYNPITVMNDAEMQMAEAQERSEQQLSKKLQPLLQILEKNQIHVTSKKLEYLETCSKLNQFQWEYKQEKQYNSKAQTTLKLKEFALEQLKFTIEMQEKEQNRLFKILNQSECQNQQMFTLKKKLNNQLQEIKGSIRVYCRVRPQKKSPGVITVTSDNTLKITYERERSRQEIQKYQQGYIFEQIFEEKDTQHQIFTELSQLIQNVIDGKNVCIFAYGQTGSGKTYTLIGPEEDGKMREQIYEERGIAPRSFEQIFRHIQMSKKFRWNFKSYLSIQEIYLENIIDLIAKAETVKDKCTEVEVTEVQEVLAFLKMASLNRKKAATNMNERSSRSHLIITLRLEGFSERNDDKRQGSLVFVDLAGSERLKQTKVEGQLLKETQFINKSLSALGTVINQMKKQSEHISFRNSKLTHVLQRYLQGQSKTLMFVNVSPDHPDLSQTKISLSFAQSVRDCKVKK